MVRVCPTETCFIPQKYEGHKSQANFNNDRASGGDFCCCYLGCKSSQAPNCRIGWDYQWPPGWLVIWDPIRFNLQCPLFLGGNAAIEKHIFSPNHFGANPATQIKVWVTYPHYRMESRRWGVCHVILVFTSQVSQFPSVPGKKKKHQFSAFIIGLSKSRKGTKKTWQRSAAKKT